MSTTVAVTENITTVTDSTSYITVSVAPATTQVTVSTGPITIGGSSYTIASGSGSPVGSVTPEFAGQLYQDTDTGQVYVSFTLSSADWIELVRNY